MMFRIPMVVFALVIGMFTPGDADAIDAVLCVKATGNGPPKFHAAKTKPPTPAACKGNEIQIGYFDGTTFQFTGINVQIVSGSGATHGTVNGRGNLIVGYNDMGSSVKNRAGSHNFVVGDHHSYSSSGGLVAGDENTISAHSSSVTGGQRNTASGGFAAVSGGYGNTASGTNSSVTGGYVNTASGTSSSVTGGYVNTASGTEATVSGGQILHQPVPQGWAAGSAAPSNTFVGNFESP